MFSKQLHNKDNNLRAGIYQPTCCAIFVFIFLNNRSRAYAWRIYTILSLLYKQENQGYGYYYRVEVPTSVKHNVTFLLCRICLPTFARISTQIVHERVIGKIYSQKVFFSFAFFACCFTKCSPKTTFTSVLPK